jgi:hypothetical protein
MCDFQSSERGGSGSRKKHELASYTDTHQAPCARTPLKHTHTHTHRHLCKRSLGTGVGATGRDFLQQKGAS